MSAEKRAVIGCAFWLASLRQRRRRFLIELKSSLGCGASTSVAGAGMSQ